MPVAGLCRYCDYPIFGDVACCFPDSKKSMVCFVPPLCLFCVHYHHEESGEEYLSCSAFDEIPDEIFSGEFEHTVPYPGDRGVLFQLNRRLDGEIADVNELRINMGLPPIDV